MRMYDRCIWSTAVDQKDNERCSTEVTRGLFLVFWGSEVLPAAMNSTAEHAYLV